MPRLIRRLRRAVDWSAKPNTKVAQLPIFLRAGAITFKNARAAWRVLASEAAAGRAGYAGDGIATRHNAGFLQQPQFQAAYDHAVQAAGWDYGVEWRLHQALWAARTARDVAGDFVELGTGRGFLMVGILNGLEDWPQGDRRLWLFDTFESSLLDGSGSHGSTSSQHYAQSYEDTARNFAPWTGVNIVKGKLPEALDGQPIHSIAFLHIDLNHYLAEVQSLRRLWPYVSFGGIILLDDYAYRGHGEQYRAMNELAQELGVDVLTTATGQGIILKMSPQGAC